MRLPEEIQKYQITSEDQNLINDLGRLVEVLVRQWPVVLVLVVLLSFAAGLASVLLPKRYKSTALVATILSFSEATFGSEIQILSEEQLLASAPGVSRFVDPSQRLQTYLRLVGNPAIAEVILEKFGDRLKEDERTVSEILKWVDGELVTRSDSISISVTYSEPQLAAEMANTWAQEYVRQINLIYSANANLEAYQGVVEQTAQAKIAFEQAQAELEKVIAQDRASELQRLIDERAKTLESLALARNELIAKLVTQRSQTALKSFEEKVTDLQTRLAHEYFELRLTERFLDDIEDMRTQVLAGGEAAAASNALALSLLKAKIFADEQSLGETLQVQTQLPTISAGQMAADLESLAGVITTRRGVLQERIQELSQQIVAAGAEPGGLGAQAQSAVQASSGLVDLEQVLALNLSGTPLDARLNALEQEVRDLNAQLAQANARLQDQTRSRDLAYDTYRNLATKEAELGVIVQTKNANVVVAAPAAAPEEDLVSGARNVFGAALVALVMGLLIIYAIEFWWAYKGIQPHPLMLRAR
jgi:uncharacterized protein involved in exopolysaccharide biosynthesis